MAKNKNPNPSTMDEFSLTDDYDALREALRYKLDEQIMKNMKHR